MFWRQIKHWRKTTCEEANCNTPPLLAVVKEDGTRLTFSEATTEQVRNSLEEKYQVRKRHDIKELIANTDPLFLKDVWEDADCYKCASETEQGDIVVCRCKPKSEVTQFDKAEALDRIHVIQTMLVELLFRNNYAPHRGLSKQAAYLMEVVNEKLYEAYQLQSEWAFEEEK